MPRSREAAATTSRQFEFEGVLVRCTAAVDEPLARTWAAEFRGWFGADRVALPNAPDAQHVALLATPLGNLVAKRERWRAFSRELARRGLKRTRSETAFEKLAALSAEGIACAEPVACVVARTCAEACAVTHQVDGLDPWRHVERHGGREQVVALLAGFAAGLHAAGFRHRDLKAPNLLLDARAGVPAVRVIDADGLDRPHALTRAMRLRDLARLCASFDSAAARAAGIGERDWTRCVELYLERSAGCGLDAGSLAARTRVWACAHAARLRERGRELA